MDTAFVQMRAPRRESRTSPAPSRAAAVEQGLYDGTLIATVNGWRRVENLRVGDRVLTLDSGPVPVTSLTAQISARRPASPARWPRLVPTGVLGNRAPLRLPPGQGVLIENEGAEAICGDCFARVPVQALDGYGGIVAVPPAPGARLWRLGFAEDQVICAEGDALVFCPAEGTAVAAGRLRYAALDADATEMLLRLLKLEGA